MVIRDFPGGCDWPVGFSTGCYYQVPILECLEVIGKAGFSELEICSHPAHFDYNDDRLVRRVAHRLRQLRLEAYSLHAPFADHIDISSPSQTVRGRAEMELLRAVDAGAVLGIRYLVLHPGPERSDLPESERRQRLQNAAEVINHVASHCRHLKIQLLLENQLGHLFAGSLEHLRWLLGAVVIPGVGTCLDTGHAFLTGDFLRVTRELAGPLRMLHVHDNHGKSDEHLPPGQGKIPWRDLYRLLLESGFQGTLIMELSHRFADAEGLRRAQESRLFLRQLGRTLHPL